MGHVLLEVMVMAVFSGLFLCMVEATVHYYDFVLKDKNFTRLCNTKSAMVVNESLPGPVVYVNRGDTVYVNVHNEGSFRVTIHWHGVKQPRIPWFDGTEYITQCAIQPGTNFTYEVVFTDEEGTLWWHAHNEWTRNTVHGAIVVYPPHGSSYPFPEPDGQEILVLGSWYNYDVNLVVEEELTTGVELPVSDAYTINSQPGDFSPCSKESTYRWQVEYGKTYLLRMVNAIMSSQVFFAIAEHNLTIVGADGAYLKPFVSSYITLAPGQTMDVILTANQSLGQYYMAARQNTVEAIYDHYETANVTAILEYRGNYTPPSSSPVFPTYTLPLYADARAGISFRNQLKSLNDQNVPKNITTRMYVTGGINELYTNKTVNLTASLATSLNNITWVNRHVDVLQAYYYNISGYYTEDFPDMPATFYNFTGQDLPDYTIQPTLGTKVKVLEYGEEVEIVFQSSNVLDAAQDHPMHLHGHSFYVVGTGLGNFDFQKDPATYNLIDPPLLNTATLPMNGWLAVRFKATNPGVWLWHCHYDHHLSYGMETVMIVKNGGTPETSMREPPAYMPPCEDEPRIFPLWKI